MSEHRQPQKNEAFTILIIILCLLISPITYYSYVNYKKISTISQSEDPFLYSASRYLYTGDWPATKNDDLMLSNYQEFKIKNNKSQEQTKEVK